MHFKKTFSNLLVASLLSCFATSTHAARHSFITKHGATENHSALLQRDADFFKATKSARKVELSKEILSPTHLVKGDEIVFNVPDETNQTAVVDSISTDVMGITTVRGRFADDPFGYLMISTDGSTLLADISLPDKKIRRAIKSKYGVHYLVEPDAAADPSLEGAPSLTVSEKDPLSTSAAPAITAAAGGGSIVPLAGVSDPATIDVLVVYTPAAKTWASANEGNISNTINQLIAKAQLACDNSQTYITMRLVHAAEVSYTETDDPGLDLDRLTWTSDGNMDNVHTLRTTYGADLVVLLESTEITGGIGWLLESASGDPSHGFSISRVQQASWSYTTIHEIGHNMGAHHHKLQNYQEGPGLYSYSAGWRWTYNTSYYCSVMTYAEGIYFEDGITHTRVAYFSDPAISLNGVPTGDSTDANNALTLRQVKHTIAAYQATALNIVETPQFSPASGTTFSTSTNVTISCSTPSAAIRYTTNGVDPTVSSTQYVAPIALTSTTTVRAKAFKSGMTDSATAIATYTGIVATPLLLPASGTTFSTSTNVTISCSTPSATIRYTTNGVDPTASSTQYVTPITLTRTTTVRAKAFKSGMTDSATAVATYTCTRPPNDNFIDAILLLGSSGSTMGTNTFATKEVGEPSHANVATATNSVWWKWTAPTAGIVRFDTLLTSFDTVLAAYTGSAVNALTEIESNDDYATGILKSLISFTATSNTTYSIAVAGYNGTNGTITLDWLFVPLNSLTTLQNGIPVTASGSRYSNAHFKIAVPSGASNLVITTSGGLADQDCDLYVLYGVPASTDFYTYKSDFAGNTEQVSVTTPLPGDWYLILYGYSAYSSVTLKASYAQNTPIITTSTLTSSSSTTNLVIQFDGNAGRTYNIQRKDSLTNLNWTTIGSYTPAENKLTTLQITITPWKPSGFYQLQMP